jgi:ATP-dependent helicase HrpB
MRRSPGSRDLVFADGGSAALSDESVVHDEPLMIAVDAEERRAIRAGTPVGQVLVRMASAVEPEWLVELYPERVVGVRSLRWNPAAGRVEEVSVTSFGQLRLEEAVRSAERSEDAARMLAEAVLARGLRDFPDSAALPALRARLALAAEQFAGALFPEPGEEFVAAAVSRACAGRRSLSELSGASLGASLLLALTPEQRRLLDRELPESVQLRGGRRVRVRYETGRPPWIESRIQDFFGMTTLPRLCGGRIQPAAHLLAPSRRPVQVTCDLAGFWKNHYPAIRKELQRRYPKHHWPEPGEAEAGTAPAGSSGRRKS